MYLKYIDIIIIIILIILFFVYLFYQLFFRTNKLVVYRVIQSINQKPYPIKIPEKKTCCDYEAKNKNLHPWKDCQMKLMCYDEFDDKCKFCINKFSCDRFSCNGNEPINPKDNYCVLC
jgi:hypothetical protein